MASEANPPALPAAQLQPIVCCAGPIIMDSRKYFPLDLTLYPERKQHFLGKFWAGKLPLGHSDHLEFPEDEHLGIIAVVELSKKDRDFAPEHEYDEVNGHDKYGKEDGEYFEVSDTSAQNMIEEGKLVATSDRMQWALQGAPG